MLAEQKVVGSNPVGRTILRRPGRVFLLYNDAMKQNKNGNKTGMKTKNKRYQKTEEAILEALMKSKELPSAGTLVKRARISRSTLYRHHKTVPGILPDYEKEVLDRYSGLIRKLLKRKNTQVRTICLRSLIFMMTERRYFGILLKYDGGVIIEKMVFKTKNKLRRTCCLPTNPDKMLRVYAKEVSGVIEEWCDQGFSENELEVVLDKILYLTDTMKQRLEPVNY